MDHKIVFIWLAGHFFPVLDTDACVHTDCILCGRRNLLPEEYLSIISDKQKISEHNNIIESIFGNTKNVITEENLKKAFGISVFIGTEQIANDNYRYIIPLYKQHE